MTTQTSFRTSIAERGSKTHELRKDSLFNLVSPIEPRLLEPEIREGEGRVGLGRQGCRR